MGLGLSTVDHCVPSQCSMTVVPVVRDEDQPTAHTSLGENAANPPRPFQISGLGESTTFHRSPSQCMVRFRKTKLPLYASCAPVAHTSFDATASTPDRELFPSATLGLG